MWAMLSGCSSAHRCNSAAYKHDLQVAIAIPLKLCAAHALQAHNMILRPEQEHQLTLALHYAAS